MSNNPPPYLFIFLFCSLFFLFSCSSEGRKTDEKRGSSASKKEISQADILPEPPITDQIIVRDIYSERIYALSELTLRRPVFIELSALWCPACEEMKVVSAKLFEYFRAKLFFIRLFPLKQLEKAEENQGVIPEMEIVSSPAALHLERNEAFPRIVVIDKKGKEVVLDEIGIYPILYYYGLLSEL